MLKVLCIHGVGHVENDPGWQEAWKTVIQTKLQQGNADVEVNFDSLAYDDYFDFSLDAATIVAAIGKLTASGASSAFDDLKDWWGGLWQRPRGLISDMRTDVGWAAGMVVQWAGDAQLRAQLRKLAADKIDAFRPDVICAHSLGSLVSYDTFAQPDTKDAIAERVFITLGSQIGNDFVKGVFGGRIELPQAKHWYHLFNRHDWVFTSPLNLSSDNFQQEETDFEDPPLNHTATLYLGHENTQEVWSGLARPAAARALAGSAQVEAAATTAPRRALLVGIDKYPNPANRLEGCVNDVFLMSAVLQETGFSADEVRVVLDERATAAGIVERLHWLLDDVRPGDQRFFFYSGHGAQMPGYGIQGTPDRIHSTLVPYDFDWTAKTAITDDIFDDFYSQLPYDARFAIVLDCCYSGGMTRGNGARVRGLDPPDDIRHRMLRWDAEHEMWVPRGFPSPNRDLSASKYKNLYLGISGVTQRLGRGIALRTLPDRQFDRVCRALGHDGPFLPIIYEACLENQFSYEYRHGVTNYGAFTYCLSRALRRHRTRGEEVTFEGLLQEVKGTLKELHFDQVPSLLGPKDLLKLPIPWQPAGMTTTRGAGS